MTQLDFISKVNQAKKTSKGDWYSVTGTVADTEYKIKGLGTWIQRMECSKAGQRVWVDSGPMDCSVKQFNEYLQERTK